MMRQFPSAIAAILLPHIVASLEDSRCTTTTTTIPYLGETTTSTTLAECSGTVTVVIETPLCGVVCSTRSTPTTTSEDCTTTSSATHRRTTTTTSTAGIPTPTKGGPCLAKPNCAPLGFDIDYYANRLGGYSSQRGVLSNYYIVDRLRPLSSSLTNVTYFPQNNFAATPPTYPNASLPNEPYFPGQTRETNGGIVVDANNFTLVYHGLYKAPATGAFQLCTTSDNENDIYFGHDNAYSCITGRPGTAADPLVMSTGGNFVNGINCATVQLEKNFYYPIRSVMGNYQGPSAFNLTVVAPGTAFSDRSNDFTGYAYPQQCGIFV